MKKVFICIIALLTTFAAKAQTTFQYGDFYYKITSASEVSVIRPTDVTIIYEMPNAVIPSTVTYDDNEYTVTKIDNSAFYLANNIESITIPPTVKIIGEQAFYHCGNVTSITFEDEDNSQLYEIEERGFADSPKSENLQIH